MTTVGELTRPPNDTYAQELLNRYLMMHRFLPTLFRTLTFESTPSGRPTLEAVQFLQRIEGRPRASLQATPSEVIPRSWQCYVLPRRAPLENGQLEVQVDRPLYTVCVVERLHESLRRHDVFVDPSERWGDPRAKLLQGEQWEGIRVQICQTLGREMSFESELVRLGQQLEEAYQRMVSHLLLNYIDDDYYRRRIQIQLNRGEGRHGVARHVFHGQRGELRQRYRQGQEDQLGALGLVVNMITLWNTWYMQDALDERRALGQEVRPEDVERLAPLRFQLMGKPLVCCLWCNCLSVSAYSCRASRMRPCPLTPCSTDLLWEVYWLALPDRFGCGSQNLCNSSGTL